MAERFVYNSGEYEDIDSRISDLRELADWFESYHGDRKDLTSEDRIVMENLKSALDGFSKLNDQLGTIDSCSGKTKRQLGK